MKKLIIILILTATPLWALQGEEQGYASWYGGKFNGRLTANGEIYDMNKLTAAHKTLPFNTYVLVTNLKNELTTIVRINDRGPFVEGRIIDLSRAGAQAIGMLGDGIAPVSLRILKTEDVPGKLKGNSPVPGKIRIQVGAYRNSSNAYRMRLKLEEAGLSSVFERSSSGVIRVMVTEITNADLEEIKRKLHSLGVEKYVIKRE